MLSGSQVNARTQDFPTEHCIVKRKSILFAPPVSRINVVGDLCMFLVLITHHLWANRNSIFNNTLFHFLTQSYMKGSIPLLCMSVQSSATARRWLALLTTGMERLCPKVNPPHITNLSLTLGKKANKVISPNVRLLLQRGPNSV